MEYRVTNVVLKSVLATGTPLDLPFLANVLTNVVYDPRQFSALRLRSKKIGGSTLLFANGYAVCHGPATNRFEARRRLLRYARVKKPARFETDGWAIREKQNPRATKGLYVRSY